MPDIEDYALPNGEIDWEAYYVDLDDYYGRIVDRINARHTHWITTAVAA